MTIQGETAAVGMYEHSLPSAEHESKRFDDPQNVLRSEEIYGQGFQSPGGLDGFKATLLDHMPALSGKRVLDIGSGLGGAAIYIAQSQRSDVVGVDQSGTMVAIAEARKADVLAKGDLMFLKGDVFCPILENGTFDVIYTKDVLMYDRKKANTFMRCRNLLRSGGSLYISDFCRIATNSEFERYVHLSNYDLPHIDMYSEIVASSGFEVKAARNVSDLAQFFLEKDLFMYRARISMGTLKAKQIDIDHIVERWERKINYLRTGLLGQIFLIAKKVH